MNEKLLKLHKYFKSLSPTKYVIISTIMGKLINLSFLPIVALYMKYIGPLGGMNENGTQTLDMFLYIVILAPIVETFLFQLGIIRVLQVFLKINNKKILILISSIVFALPHTYSPLYIFIMFFHGLIYAYSFIIYDDKEYHPYLIVTLMHSLSNLIAFL